MPDSNYQNISHYLDTGDNDKAIHMCRNTAHLEEKGDICYLLGLAYMRTSRFEHALKYLKLSVQLSPEDYLPIYTLGQLYKVSANPHEATKQFEQAIKINPGAAEIYYDLGTTLMDSGLLVKSCEYFKACLRIETEHPAAAIKLGLALIRLGQYDEAITVLQKSLKKTPNQPGIYNCLSYAYEQSGDLAKAEKCVRMEIKQSPDSPEAYSNLGNILKARGKAEDAIECFRKALLIQPDFSGINSNLLLCMNYVPSISLNEMFLEHKKWATTLNNLEHLHKNPLNKTSNRKIRIGYVSPDFRIHPVVHFFLPILNNHDRKKYEIYCYAEVDNPDWFTREVEKLSDGWINTCGMTDVAVAEKIQTDNIDILIDLAGHTGGNRLGVFAFKPAPVQATYLGYPNTTGLDAIDYRISDVILDPAGSENFYTEKLIRLKNGFSCYSPPRFYPDVPDLPHQKNGFITFGSFNNPAKFNTHVFSVWSQVLTAVPNSHILFYRDVFSRQEKENLIELCIANGIHQERITVLNKAPDNDSRLPPARRYLEVMGGEVDICLDTFPWNGHTTACESLWMGVPVVTLYGDRPSSRLCTSVLNQLDLPHLAAKNENEYVEIATELALQPDKLAVLRSSLRHRMESSILCNGKLFTHSLEQTYEEMLKHSINVNSTSKN